MNCLQLQSRLNHRPFVLIEEECTCNINPLRIKMYNRPGELLSLLTKENLRRSGSSKIVEMCSNKSNSVSNDYLRTIWIKLSLGIEKSFF